ncbi:Putative TetR-family transcriptional regulator [Salmonella enterica subsp. enterica serovar Alachua str. R6-377]|uniref:Putative TetR-family transcriptional regulator n=1 Tax=Salmonella enterica subsp. enterica serovar Alachua str. R6-377 TaxID=913241 RepID=G5LP90_SALET|nr:Putative TetR-family transcriptional regulator [Salmonella enterica subsp. enterica serovar Alachua str. R6-377]
MDKGAQEIMALLARALEDGRNSHCLHFTGQPLPQAQVLYALWLGANLHNLQAKISRSANLQAKISRSAAPLENALAHVKTIIATPEQ